MDGVDQLSDRPGQRRERRIAGGTPARLRVRLTPRGGRDGLDGWASDADGQPYLKARVAAAPVDGEANGALIKLIAKALAVAQSAVTVVSGETARVKTLEIEGMTQDEVMRKLGVPSPSRGEGQG